MSREDYLTKEFQALKKEHEDKKQELIAVRTQLEGIDQRLSELSEEIKALGFNSFEELQKGIASLEKSIEKRIEEIKSKLCQM